MTKGIVWTCGHAHPDVSNERFTWLGKFIYDIKPDWTMDLGDGADMQSLNSYDTSSPRMVVSQSYEKDIEAYNDSQERITWPFRRAKKKRPHRRGIEGNHEHRIKKAIAREPRQEGLRYGISFGHLQTDHWFDEYHEYKYSAPAIVDYDRISYSHYFTTGNSPTAISGIHHAYSLLQHRNHSSICGHSHKRDCYFKDGAHPSGLFALVAGCFKGGPEEWAGQSNNSWWSGAVILDDVENGMASPTFVSLEKIRKEYGE